MSQIRSDILHQRQIKEVSQADQQMKRLHIATPIASDDFDDPDGQLQIINEEDDELIILSDDDNEKDVDNTMNKEKEDEGDPNTEENENQWSAIISRWVEEANYENRVENSDDEIFLNDDLINDFSVGARDIHPADDPSAKWELESLFVNSLESPTYTGFFSDKQIV
jgi:hypothetical protein